MDEWKIQPARDLGLSPTKRLRSLQRESGLAQSALHQLWWAAVRCHLAVWHRPEIHGRIHLPSHPPFVLVANHSSHLDTFVLSSILSWRWRDRIFPIAAGDTFFETPAQTCFSALAMNALPMWRRKCGSHALAELRRKLVEDCGIYILFPEGTRSRNGNMAPFKPGVGMLVAGNNVPVVPARLCGAFEAWPTCRRLPRPGRIRVELGPPMSFASVRNDREGWLQVAHRTEEAVRGLGLSCAP